MVQLLQDVGAGAAAVLDWLPCWSMKNLKPAVLALPTACIWNVVAVRVVGQETVKVPYVAAVAQGGVKPLAARYVRLSWK
jgi:hypothetical protein